MDRKFFKYKNGQLPLPVFFPDATRAVVRSIDTLDLENTKTPGILVNTFHLWQELGTGVLKKFGGVREFMDFPGGVISDSGGFQVMSVIKSGQVKGRITDEGAIFYPSKNKKKIKMPLSEFEKQRVKKIFSAYCAMKAPHHISDQFRVEFELRGSEVKLFESRPDWRDKSKWVSHKAAMALRTLGITPEKPAPVAA